MAVVQHQWCLGKKKVTVHQSWRKWFVSHLGKRLHQITVGTWFSRYMTIPLRPTLRFWCPDNWNHAANEWMRGSWGCRELTKCWLVCSKSMFQTMSMVRVRSWVNRVSTFQNYRAFCTAPVDCWSIGKVDAFMVIFKIVKSGYFISNYEFQYIFDFYLQKT